MIRPAILALLALGVSACNSKPPASYDIPAYTPPVYEALPEGSVDETKVSTRYTGANGYEVVETIVGRPYTPSANPAPRPPPVVYAGASSYGYSPYRYYAPPYWYYPGTRSYYHHGASKIFGIPIGGGSHHHHHHHRRR